LPKAKRKRVIEADRQRVWDVVSDPYHLARWWPRTRRVEDVHERRRGTGTQWTNVMQAKSGRDVRADFRCLYSREREAYAWEQQVAGTPFDKLLHSSVTSIDLEDAGSGTKAGTLVTMRMEQKMRGVNKFGGFMARSAAKRQLDEALRGLEQALGADQ
jgi:uncharacterized protein YndB with AHSA1/START domain